MALIVDREPYERREPSWGARLSDEERVVVADEIAHVLLAFQRGQRYAQVFTASCEVTAERLPTGVHLTIGFR